MPAVPDIVTEIAVVGAGVLGLCTAAELSARGHAVTVIDSGEVNASSVAAGMIAPALESILERCTPGRARLLKAARDLWPAFAARSGLSLVRDGAEWRGDGAAEVAQRLHDLGFDARLQGGSVFTSDDWRIDAAAALQSLRAGLPVIAARVVDMEREAGGWRLRTSGEAVIRASVVVLATGVGTAIPGAPEAVAALVGSIEPIKGQLAYVERPLADHMVRGPGVYVAPTTGGVLLGATMEAGRRDLDWDEAAVGPVIAAGLAMVGHDGARPLLTPGVGVRGASPDGLPMAGWSGEAGLHLALAPRRNGWLLGPLVARTVADGIEGGGPGPLAAALDPRRFRTG